MSAVSNCAFFLAPLIIYLFCAIFFMYALNGVRATRSALGVLVFLTFFLALCVLLELIE